MIRRLVAPLVLAVGCNSTGVGNPPRAPEELSTQESELLADGDDANRAGDGASSLVAIPLLAFRNADPFASSEGAAALGELSRLAFQPSTCVSSARATDVVTWTFTGCQGPFGLAQVDGKLIATYAVRAASSLEVKVRSDGLRLAMADGLTLVRADVTLEATAVLTLAASGAQSTRWQGRYDVAFPARRLTHEASYELTRAAECLQLGGTASTSLTDGRGARSIKTTLSGYERCGDRRACPARGTLTIDRPPASVSVEFLGGQAVEVTSAERPEPRTFERALRCVP
jgi:hypothetical protein